MERFGALGYDLCKNNMKKDMKRSLTNQISKPWLQGILFKFVDLMASIQVPDHNPNGKRQEAAPKKSLQHWNFL